MNFSDNNNDRFQGMSRIAMVGGLHVLLFILIVNSAKHGPFNHPADPPKPIHVDPPVIVALEPKHIDLKPLPIPPMYVAPPEIYVPKNDTAPPLPPDVTTIKPERKVEPPVGPGKVLKEHIEAVLASSSCDKPEYPSASIRAEESGIVTLALLVDVDGRVVDSRVDKSSGYQALDKAAKSALSLCKFKPGKTNGVAEKSWTRIQYAWALDQ